MWKSRDPIPTFTTYLRARHVLDDPHQKEIEARVTKTIDEALEYAMNAPEPDAHDAVTDLYAKRPGPRRHDEHEGSRRGSCT